MVLQKALQVFWRNGFTGTGLKDLEDATGVNKSGLYSEFKDKEDLFLESLKHYFSNRPNREILKRQPLGFKNIADFLSSAADQKTQGCFAVNTLREISGPCSGAEDLIETNRKILAKLFEQNLAAEIPKPSSKALAQVCLTFYYGLQAEQNLKKSRSTVRARAKIFIEALQALP